MGTPSGPTTAPPTPDPTFLEKAQGLWNSAYESASGPTQWLVDNVVGKGSDKDGVIDYLLPNSVGGLIMTGGMWATSLFNKIGEWGFLGRCVSWVGKAAVAAVTFVGMFGAHLGEGPKMAMAKALVGTGLALYAGSDASGAAQAIVYGLTAAGVANDGIDAYRGSDGTVKGTWDKFTGKVAGDARGALSAMPPPVRRVVGAGVDSVTGGATILGVDSGAQRGILKGLGRLEAGLEASSDALKLDNSQKDRLRGMLDGLKTDDKFKLTEDNIGMAYALAGSVQGLQDQGRSAGVFSDLADMHSVFTNDRRDGVINDTNDTDDIDNLNVSNPVVEPTKLNAAGYLALAQQKFRLTN